MIGQAIKNYREARRLTQKELAQKLNVSQQTIGSWERGRTEPSIEMQQTLADFFNVSLNDLLGYSSDNIDLKQLLKNESMTYGGKEISNDDLNVLTRIIEGYLGDK